MTQSERLIKYLKTGKRIDPLTSWRELGIYRLASRINELASKMEIKRDWKEVTNQHGEKTKVMEYWL